MYRIMREKGKVNLLVDAEGLIEFANKEAQAFDFESFGEYSEYDLMLDEAIEVLSCSMLDEDVYTITEV